MGTADEEDPDVKRDLRDMPSSFTSEDLNPDIMFTKKRGIRSCTPPFTSEKTGDHVVHERLRRVPAPESDEEK